MTDYKGYRDLTIAVLQQLTLLDGKEVSRSERILARQRLPELLEDVESYTEIVRVKRAQKEKERALLDFDDPNRQSQHHPDERKRIYFEQQQSKDEEERRKNPEKFKEKAPQTSKYKKDEEKVLRQCNEGKYHY